jgi:hypothetical protein
MDPAVLHNEHRVSQLVQEAAFDFDGYQKAILDESAHKLGARLVKALRLVPNQWVTVRHGGVGFENNPDTLSTKIVERLEARESDEQARELWQILVMLKRELERHETRPGFYEFPVAAWIEARRRMELLPIAQEMNGR